MGTAVVRCGRLGKKQKNKQKNKLKNNWWFLWLFFFYYFVLFFFEKGVDIIPENIEWARKNSLGKYCLTDAKSDLSWLPNNYFDRVIAFASVGTMPVHVQCRIVSDFISKLKPGGIGWVGWLNPSIYFDHSCGQNMTDRDGNREQAKSKYEVKIWSQSQNMKPKSKYEVKIWSQSQNMKSKYEVKIWSQRKIQKQRRPFGTI